MKHWPDRKLYKLMAEVGVEHFSVELIIDCPCDRREVLLRAEGEQIRLHKTAEEGCNAKMAGRSQKDSNTAFREAHREERNAATKAYNEAHREERKANRKAYYEANRAEHSVKAKTYYEANRADRSVKAKAYSDAHREEIKNYKKAYYLRKKTEREAQA